MPDPSTLVMYTALNEVMCKFVQTEYIVSLERFFKSLNYLMPLFRMGRDFVGHQMLHVWRVEAKQLDWAEDIKRTFSTSRLT